MISTDTSYYVTSVYDDNDPRLASKPRLRLNHSQQMSIIENVNRKNELGNPAPVVMNHALITDEEKQIYIPDAAILDLHRVGNVISAWKTGSKIMLKFSIEPSRYTQMGIGYVAKVLVDKHFMFQASLRHNNLTGEIEELSIVKKGARYGCVIIPWEIFIKNGYTPIESYSKLGISVMASQSVQDNQNQQQQQQGQGQMQSLPSPSAPPSSTSNIKPTPVSFGDHYDALRSKNANGPYEFNQEHMDDLIDRMTKNAETTEKLKADLKAANEANEKLKSKMNDQRVEQRTRSEAIISALEQLIDPKSGPSNVMKTVKNQHQKFVSGQSDNSILCSDSFELLISNVVDDVKRSQIRDAEFKANGNQPVKGQINALLSGSNIDINSLRSNKRARSDDTPAVNAQSSSSSSSSSSVLASDDLNQPRQSSSAVFNNPLSNMTRQLFNMSARFS